MIQEAYIEIGNACYAKCTTCNIPNQKSKQMEIDDYIKIIESLKAMGCNKVRLTGNEPMTHRRMIDLIGIAHEHEMLVDVLTTLLNPSKHALQTFMMADKCRVSLSNVGSEYENYFNVPLWTRFDANFKELIMGLAPARTAFINCTLYAGNSTQESCMAIIDYLNGHVLHGDSSAIHAAFFHSLDYSNSLPEYDQQMVTQMYNELLAKFATFSYDEVSGVETHKMSTCNSAGTNLYIKTNGDMYPCCMSGGELGQELVECLKLGNIYEMHDWQCFEFKRILTDLDNKICDKCTPKYYGSMPKHWRKS